MEDHSEDGDEQQLAGFRRKAEPIVAVGILQVGGSVRVKQQGEAQHKETVAQHHKGGKEDRDSKAFCRMDFV